VITPGLKASRAVLGPVLCAFNEGRAFSKLRFHSGARTPRLA